MNFLEFLREDHGKTLYVLINTQTGDIPKESPTEPYRSWAKDADDAKTSIIANLKTGGDKYSWKVLNNADEYTAITWDRYQKIEDHRQKVTVHTLRSPISATSDQLTMFNEPTSTTPY